MTQLCYMIVCVNVSLDVMSRSVWCELIVGSLIRHSDATLAGFFDTTWSHQLPAPERLDLPIEMGGEWTPTRIHISLSGNRRSASGHNRLASNSGSDVCYRGEGKSRKEELFEKPRHSANAMQI